MTLAQAKAEIIRLEDLLSRSYIALVEVDKDYNDYGGIDTTTIEIVRKALKEYME